jgi:tetratricopeptide (TPR) repeat protein
MSVAAEAQVEPVDLLKQAEDAMAKGDWNGACEILEASATHVPVRERLAFCLSRAKRYDDAIANLEQLRNLQPRKTKWSYMLGYQYYEQERYAEALPHFVKAWKLAPRHLRNLYRLAQTRLHLDEAERAKRGAAEVLRLWQQLPPDRQAREKATMAKSAYLLGREELKNNPTKAVEPLRLAAEHDPGEVNRHYLLGKALRKAKRPEEAMEPLRRAARMKPGQPYIELELAVALALLPEGRDEAAERLAKIERRLSDWQALKGAGLAATLGDSHRARRLLKRAARKGFVRRSPAFAAVEEKVDQLPDLREKQDGGSDEEMFKGRVDMINRRRGFGFLTDQTDEIRRYFKLPRDLKIRRGDRIIYRPREADKGPAADVIGLCN